MKNLLVCLAILLYTTQTFSQGKLLIVGGGSEAFGTNGVLQGGSWSDTAYRWAVEQAPNKRVAVISTDAETDELPAYFRNLGAVAAQNIRINSRSQNGMYDSLMKYDFIFFRGGDQSEYYNFFKDTAVMRACIDKYAQGGVLGGTSAGMHILSSVVYTANHSGSLLSDEALENPNSNRISAGLADDFFGTFPNYIFDTHFSERGRFPRLVAMMAHWEVTKNKYPVLGIGMSDQNAMCISGNVGVSWGTASTQIFGKAKNYRISNFSQYGTSHRSLAFDSMNVIKLVNGDTIDFTTFQVRSAPTKKIGTAPRVASENGNYRVYLSGANEISLNNELFDSLANGTDALPKADLVLILTGATTTNANAVRTALQNRGFTNVVVQQATTTNTDTVNFRNQIQTANTFIFVGNALTQLNSFIVTPVGALLTPKIKSDNVTSVFIGENSHYAGATTAPDAIHTTYSLSYNGNFSYSKGLGVLQTSTIIARAFDYDLYTSTTNNAWENQANIIPFIIAKDSLRYGIWLNEGTFLKYSVVGSKSYFSSFGKVAAIILENKGTFYEEVSRRFNNSSSRIRDLVGVGSMQMRYIDRESVPLEVGSIVPSAPIASFIQPADTIAVGDSITFTNTSRFATNYSWLINDQVFSTVTDAGKRFTGTGIYTIKLSAASIHGDDTAMRVLVVVTPIASFHVSADTVGITDTVSFINTTHFGSSFLWYVNNMPIAMTTNAGRRFDSSGVYTIRLTVNAIDSTERTVIVPNPSASFILSADTVNIGDSVSFTNTSRFAKTYSWRVGTSVLATTFHAGQRFNSSGDYVITLVVRAGNKADSISKTVHVRQPLGLATENSTTYSLSPNPVKDVLRISGVNQTLIVQISDVIGNSLLKETITEDTTLTMAHFKAGLYLVKVTDSKGKTTVTKILKE